MATSVDAMVTGTVSEMEKAKVTKVMATVMTTESARARTMGIVMARVAATATVKVTAMMMATTMGTAMV
jgi:hypothetical protein